MVLFCFSFGLRLCVIPKWGQYEIKGPFPTALQRLLPPFEGECFEHPHTSCLLPISLDANGTIHTHLSHVKKYINCLLEWFGISVGVIEWRITA